MSAKKSLTQQMFMEEDEPSGSPIVEEKKVESKESEVKLDYGMIVELPSGGKLGYPSSVTYRDMLVRDEEVLASATASTYTKVLNGVLKDVANGCEFFEQMSTHDRDFLLVWFWANNYSPIKKISVTCRNSECKKEHEHSIDLTKLKVDDIKENIKNPFTLELKNGNSVQVRMVTVGDEIKSEEYKRLNPDSPHSIENLMMYASISVGISIPFESKIEWIMNNITTKEMGIIKNYHRYFSFGVKKTVDCKCPSCGEVTTVALPFQAEDVLFPSVSTDFEEYL